MAQRFRKNNKLPTSYHQNQFAASFDPWTRRRSLSELQSSQDAADHHRDRTRHGRSHHKGSGRLTSSPISMTMKSNIFSDRESRQVLKRIEAESCKPLRAKKLLTEQGEKLKRITRDSLIITEESLTYQTLLEELIFDEEWLIIDRGLHYNYLEFKDEKNELFLKPTMAEGRIFLTSSRLIMLTAEQLKGTTLSRIDDPIQGPGQYQVAAYHNEEYHYQFIPLGCVKSIEMHTRSGGQAEVNIQTHLPCCAILGQLIGKIFGVTLCTETWKPAGGPMGAEYIERIIILGVSMPPWMTPMNVKVHVSSEVPLKLLTHFISLIQSFCPFIASCGIPAVIADEDETVVTKKTTVNDKKRHEEVEYSELGTEGVQAPVEPQEPVIDVKRLQFSKYNRGGRPKAIPQPYGIYGTPNVMNAAYFDQRAAQMLLLNNNHSEYEAKYVHHAMQHIPQVQLRMTRDEQEAIRNLKEEKDKLEKLVSRREFMRGRKLPVPDPEQVEHKLSTEDQDKATGVCSFGYDDHHEIDEVLEFYDNSSTVQLCSGDTPSYFEYPKKTKKIEQSREIRQYSPVVAAAAGITEEESEGEGVEVILRSGAKGYKVIDTELGNGGAGNTRSEWKEREVNVDYKRCKDKDTCQPSKKGSARNSQPVYEAIPLTETKMTTEQIKCVCPHCLAKSVDGTHWAPLRRDGDLIVPGNVNLERNTKKGLCMCARCIEAGNGSQCQDEDHSDDISVI